jgi:hypothetical protein
MLCTEIKEEIPNGYAANNICRDCTKYKPKKVRH